MQAILQFAVRHLGGVLVEKLVSRMSAALTNWLVERAIKGVDTSVESHDLERYYLLKEIRSIPRGEQGNEKRKIMSITLARLSRGELSDSDGERDSEV